MGQKCEGNCGLRVLNEIILKKYPENLKKILGGHEDRLSPFFGRLCPPTI